MRARLHPRRTPAVITGALLSIALVGSTVNPAAAQQPTVDSSTVVQLEGDLVILAGEVAAESTSTTDTLRNGVVATPQPDAVLLVTDSGVTVELTGDILDDAVSGSTFSGTVSVSADVAAQVEDDLPVQGEREGDVVDGDSVLGTQIVEATAELEASLDVIEGEVTAPVLKKAVAARVHTLDIAVVTLPDNPTDKVLADSEIASIVTNLDTYWPTQTAGQVAGVITPVAVKRIVSADACDPQAAWEAAAPLFGASPDYYWLNNESDHLVVLAPSSCSDAGLGSLGSLESGGTVWASHLPSVTAQTLAHEFGHNLGLEHSNRLVCEGSASEGSGCSIDQYWDLYDIMGLGLYYVGLNGVNISNRRFMALNVTHKVALDAISSADLPTMTLGATGYRQTAFNLQPASALSGVRGIRVTDPATGQDYYVEYRSGTGIDAGALYAAELWSDLAVGVRILKLESDGSSTVVTRPIGSEGDRAPFFTAGQTFTSISGQVKVAVTGMGAAAQVSISLGKPPLQFTASPAATISGFAQVGTKLTASVPVWTPTPASLTYQWSRGGTQITGATATTYTPTDADLGRQLSVAVTGTKPGYATVTRVSALTAAVVDASVMPPPVVERFAGTDRYMTGVAISNKSFSPGVPVVYVATGLSFPDALAAAPAAAAQGGPLLLTAATALPASVKTEIDRLDPKQIVVVGGTGAVSASVYNELAGLTTSIRRDAGIDRFATSRTIVEKAFTGVHTTAYVATAWNYPDALAASAAAGAIGAPVVLVDGKGTAVDAKTKELLSKLQVSKAFVAGGTGVVSTAMEASLKSILGTANVTRLGGIDRYTTATVINKASFSQSDTVYFANGLGFADALSGAALAGKNKAPLYTVLANCVPQPVLAELTRLGAKKVVLLGGAGALNNDVMRLVSCK